MRIGLSRIAAAVACAAGLAASVSAGENPVEVIFSEILTSDTSLIPGLKGERFTGLLDVSESPNGAWWIFKGFTDGESAVNDVMVVGTGKTGWAVALEGDPSPIPGATYGFMDSDAAINNNGHYAFGNRLSGVGTTTDEIIFLYNGSEIVSGVREGDAAPGLQDPNGAGNELFGNSLNSPNVTTDGRLGFRADLIQNINTNFRSAAYFDGAPVIQEGTNVDGVTIDSIFAIGGTYFKVSADGEDYIAAVDMNPSLTATDDAVVLTGQVVLRKGDPIPPMASTVDDVFGIDIDGAGNWYARGDDLSERDWAVRNGEFIAWTGGPVTSSGSENWGPVIYLATGNASGDYLVGGETDNADLNANEVIVLNGQTVLVREGKEVDVNGDGILNDNVYIRTIQPDDAFLGNDGYLYFFATLRDKVGTNLGDAFLRVAIDSGNSCPTDINGDGVVNAADLAAVLGSWGLPGSTDFDGNGTTGSEDLAFLLGSWGPCP